MDPLLFGVNYDVVGEAIGLIVILSLFVERFLAPWFEWRVFIAKFDGKGYKEPIAFAVSLGVVMWAEFDAIAVILQHEQTHWVGYGLTAGIVAGGSKGSIKLFRDFLGWKSEAETARTAAAGAGAGAGGGTT